ncbi:UbiA prenyltransferase family protein [Actinoplanes sp. NPDC023801]|uniref:UbiA prenyltransferase family protein n=1 Tax=Actinoplanes sp. NPDC023801 TaxID=3154595 RepID=UPI0033C285E3
MVNHVSIPSSGVLTSDNLQRPHWRALLALVRPHQWSKNLIAVPLALLGNPVLPLSGYLRLAWITCLFILASALVYVLNDYADRHRDRSHPVKRNRPIASGEISPVEAVIVATTLAAALLALTVLGPWWAAWPAYLYLALNLAYSCGLKHVPLLDVLIVSCGFVLRAVAGCVVLSIELSGWLALTVFAGSILLSLGKRRHEMIQASGEGHRPALGAYSVQLLDNLILLNSAIVLMATMTLFYTDLSSQYGRAAMMFSAPFAVLLIFRYLQVLFVSGGGSEPARLLVRDRPIVGTALLWAVTLIGLRITEWADVQWMA